MTFWTCHFVADGSAICLSSSTLGLLGSSLLTGSDISLEAIDICASKDGSGNVPVIGVSDELVAGVGLLCARHGVVCVGVLGLVCPGLANTIM
jgi:hypothetical protein